MQLHGDQSLGCLDLEIQAVLRQGGLEVFQEGGLWFGLKPLPLPFLEFFRVHIDLAAVRQADRDLAGYGQNDAIHVGIIFALDTLAHFKAKLVNQLAGFLQRAIFIELSKGRLDYISRTRRLRRLLWICLETARN